LAAAFLVMDW